MIFNKKELSNPIIIAGPCSAENSDQVMDAALQLAGMGIKFFRAGAWKPRTMPGSFEGFGIKALQWIKQAKEATGLTVGTEVANAKHVELSVKYGIDFVWIGARTTANPFAVQEIADSLQGVKIPVLIKNPVNPELSLWIGAIERIRNSGITEIVAVHRGFSTYRETIYRNTPHWNIPFELMRQFPEIPVLCDPSHIGGKACLIQQISQQAFNLGFDGIMVESHPNPKIALSDKNQQITPSELKEILTKLTLRDQNDQSKIIENLRHRIDELDSELLETLAKRMEVSKEIGKYKEEHNIPILQTDRYSTLISDRVKQASQLGINKEFMRTILELIHEESVNQQSTYCREK